MKVLSEKITSVEKKTTNSFNTKNKYFLYLFIRIFLFSLLIIFWLHCYAKSMFLVYHMINFFQIIIPSSQRVFSNSQTLRICRKKCEIFKLLCSFKS